MKVIIQRVKSAACTVDNQITGKIDKGYMLLVSFKSTDSLTDVSYIEKCCKKIANLRIFDDEDGKMNKSIIDVNGSILSISQFTLYGNPYSGNRPSFTDAMKFDDAIVLYKKFNDILRNQYNINVAEGIFGEHMYLDISCDGPVTIEVEF